MAELWNLPVVFVIENNQLRHGHLGQRSTKSRTSGSAARPTGSGRGGGRHGRPRGQGAGERAVAHCRSGAGPYILEVKTYRYRGHSMSDPAKYRTREEVQKMKDERDPIEQVRSMLSTGSHATEDDLKAIDREIKEIVNESAEFSKESPSRTRKSFGRTSGVRWQRSTRAYLTSNGHQSASAGDGQATISTPEPRSRDRHGAFHVTSRQDATIPKPPSRWTDRARLDLPTKPRNHECHQHPDARPVPHHGGGHPCAMAQEGGRPGQVGDILAEIETDKATMEFEAVDEGPLGRILVPEGTEGVKVNAPIAVLIGEGEDASAAATIPTQAEGGTEPAQAAAGTIAVHGDSPRMAARQKEDGAAVFQTPAPVEAKDPSHARLPGRAPHPDHHHPRGPSRGHVEEMRRDETVFLMGEEVGEYQGAYKISQGMLDEFGPSACRHAHHRARLRRHRRRRGLRGLKPIVEFMTFNFAMQAIDHLINSAAKTLYMSGGQMGCPSSSAAQRRRRARGAQHSQDYAAWYMQVPGLRGRDALLGADAKGLMKTRSATRTP
jgi:hypothetical protein